MTDSPSQWKLPPIVHGLAAVCWGAVPVWFYSTERLHYYLKGPFQTYALIGGLGLIVLGLFNILTAKDETHCGHDHCDHDHDHDHDHDDHEHTHEDQNPLVTVLLMIIPVIIGVSFTKDSYSTAALARKGAFSDNSDALQAYFDSLPPYTLEILEQRTPKTQDGDYLMEITEIQYSANDPEMRDVLDDLPVALIGQVMPEKEKLNPNENRLRLYRLFMNCCAADATVIGVPIEFSGPVPTLEEKGWFKVSANIAYGELDKSKATYLKVRSITPTENPNKLRRQSPFEFR